MAESHSPPLAEPFAQIFTDRAEADWTFDLLRDTAKRLGIQGAYDPRFAITLARRSGRIGLHLNFGGWLVLGFHGPGVVPKDLTGFKNLSGLPYRVDLALLASLVSWDERFNFFAFACKEGEPEVRSYHLPLDLVRPMTSDVQSAYLATLDFIAQKFSTWKRASHWKQHNPEIAEALFKPEEREQLFAGSLTEPELRYERHLTAFYQDISEEREEYEVELLEAEAKAEADWVVKTRGGEEAGEKTDFEYSTTRSSNMGLNQNKIEEKLNIAFAEFRQNFRDIFIVRLRRKRAEQLRQLLSNPERVDLQTFNQEVWVIQSKTNFGKTIRLYDEKPTSLEQIREIENAIETGERELHGNCIWGSASRVYAPRLKDDSEKIRYLRQALGILNDLNLTPHQKTQQLRRVYGFGPNIATGLVMMFHPGEFGLYNEAGKTIIRNLGYKIDDSLDAYQEILQSLKKSLNTEDFLELDWFLYQVNQGKYNIKTIELPQPSEESFLITDEVIEDQVIARIIPYPLPQLAEDTALDEAELARWVRAIERKGQAILYGPPGTGKTFVAEKLARHLIGGGDGLVELVQFHPAYAYEDFIQGIRPESQGDFLTYPLKPGRFLEFCEKAKNRQDTCVLLIDEINRANLSRVFGELMYLLEYRERAIPLAGGGAFTIPANVRLIGTMNTADRSIALVDHALRRRFAFIALYPNFDLLRRYHQQQQTGFPVEKLVGLLQKLNHTIADRHYEVGVTFFLRPNLSGEIEDIWRMEIEPYLEEYFFDRADTVEEFRWEKIKSQIVAD